MFNARLVSYIILLSFVLSSFAAIEPLCKWHGTSPFCFFRNSCAKDCWQVTSNNRGDGARCWFEIKLYIDLLTMTSLKKTTTLIILLLLTIVPKSTDALCKWYGIAPFCFIGNSCPDGCAKTLESNKGDGLTCWVSHKKYCCCLPGFV